MTIGNEIDMALRLLFDSKLSGYMIAKETGLTETTISNYRHGRTRPTLANARLLISFFNNKSQAIKIYDIENFNLIMVPFISKSNYRKYINNTGNEEFVSELPKIPYFSNKELSREAIYRAVEFPYGTTTTQTLGNVMEGDILICKEIKLSSLSEAGHGPSPLLVIFTQKEVHICTVAQYDAHHKSLNIRALGKDDPELEIPLSGIVELFKVVSLFRSSSN